MFSFYQARTGLAHMLRTSKGSRKSSKALSSGQLRLEVLEERQLLTMTPVGAPSIVEDPYFSLPQTAMDAQGNYVAVWESFGGDESGTAIKAVRYDAAGVPLGDAFIVNTFATGDQKSPRVAMNDSGAFVVVWQSAGQDGSGWGVFAQRYDAIGTPLGGEFQVNTTTAGDQTAPDVALNDSGQFAVSWYHSTGILNQARLRVASFRANGVANSGEVTVANTTLSSTGVGIDAAGDFVAATFTGSVISARRYDFAGTPQGTQYSVTANDLGSAFTDDPRVRVAMNDSGEFILAAAKTKTVVQRFNSAGDLQGNRILLDSDNVHDQLSHRLDFGLAIDDAGNSLISLNPLPNPGQSPLSVPLKIFKYDANGLPAGDPIVVATGSFYLNSASVSMNDAGQAVVAWFDYKVGDPNDPQTIFSQVLTQRLQESDFRLTGLATGQDEDLLLGVPPVTEVRVLVTSFSLPVSTAGGAAGAGSVLNPANWHLLRGNVDISDQIAGITYANGRASLMLAAPLATGGYRLIARDTIEQLGGGMLDGDSNDVAGGDSVSEFKIGPTFPVGDQRTLSPAHEPLSNPSIVTNRTIVAANAAGASVAVVVSGQARTSLDVTAQRFNEAGAAVGDPIVIATHVSLTADDYIAVKAAVGMSDDGSFFVAWNPTNELAILVQRFNHEGLAVGPVLHVSDPSDTGQTTLMGMAVSGAGAFSVAYFTRTYGDGRPKIAMFSANGTPVAQFSATRGDHSDSSVGLAYTLTGQLVTTWEGSGIISPATSSPGLGTYAQRFDAAGQPVSGLVFVGPVTFGGVLNFPQIAANPAGGFAIAWQGLTSGLNVLARIYDEQAQPVTSAFYANSEPIDFIVLQIVPALAFDSANHLLVSWEGRPVKDHPSGGNDPYTGDIWGRTFYANGTPLADQFRLNTITNRYQNHPSVASNGAGQFMVAWSDDNSQLQRLRVIDPPILDLNGPVEGLDFVANQFQAGASPVRLVDAGLFVTDPNTSQITMARVAIANPLPGDLLSVDTTGTTLVANYLNGVLTLTGVASPESYQQVLRTTQFEGNAAHSNGVVLPIKFSVVDANGSESAPAYSHVTIYKPGAGSVAGRLVFYDHSKFDRFAGSDSSDDFAIAADKQAYLPGSGLATFNNIACYSRGINGIMIDLDTEKGVPVLSDFSFKVGTGNDVASWTNAPTTIDFTVRPGVGVNGTNRVSIYWSDNAIKNTWLEITVAANGHTGLATPDVFYFGNLTGDTGGNPAGLAMTSAVDSLAIRFHPGANAPVTSLYDIDRNGMVNAADELAARSNPGTLKMLNLPPIMVATAQTLPEIVGSRSTNSNAGLAFALALGVKSETGTSVVRPLSVEPLAATVNQAARQAAVAAIVADERVAFNLSATESQAAEESQSEDWLSLALD